MDRAHLLRGVGAIDKFIRPEYAASVYKQFIF